ncbi:right-handed parallel beta-helix repeat-containing protein [candidate division KSB1 bacterium]|nr:right-handed parallel beta-helix repeat-containing protein [candidate division KSB1 bacterium]
MKLSAILAALFLAALAAGNLAQATVRTVSPVVGAAQFTTMGDAYNAAVNGDTIVVGPGSYSASFGSYKRLHWIGAGWDYTTITGSYALWFYGTSTGSVFEGFKVDASYYALYAVAPVDSITIRRCHISSSTGCIYYDAGHLNVEDCVLFGNSSITLLGFATANAGPLVVRNTVFTYLPGYTGYTISGAHGATVELYNNVWVNVQYAFNLVGTAQVIGLNNICFDWQNSPTWGTLPAGSIFEYTATDNSAPAFNAFFTNNIALGGDNPFVTYSTGANYSYPGTDLHLNALAGGLACTNTGYPSVLDLDGSRSDLGIYGGPKPFVVHGIAAYPFALTLTIDPLVEVGDSVGVSSTGRIGPRY